MIPPCSRVQSQTSSTNLSRPRSSFSTSCFASLPSTCFCVAIPAWSVPKIHFARRPFMRAQRMSTSWIEPFSAWPMCSAPVTFGGGTAIEKFSLASPSGAGWLIPDSSQRCAIRGSASAGS
jgi:hypothetical protein